MRNYDESNLGDTSKCNKQRRVKDRSHRNSGHEGLIPVIPSQGKYIYVGGAWSLLGNPTSRFMLTLFYMCYSREGIARSTMRST